MNKEHTRRFSLEDDFMNYKTDDLLYGFMRSLSTARTSYKNGKEELREYLTVKEFTKSKKVIAGICGCSTRTIERHLNDLINAGLVEYGVETIDTVDKYNNIISYNYPCYWFPYDETKRYKILNKEMVRYLVDTRSAQAIKVYLYLLNKYEWKDNYIFTIKEIQVALGYGADSNTARITVGNILDSLAREGVIRFENITDYDMSGDQVIAIPRKQLKFVAKSINQLRAI